MKNKLVLTLSLAASCLFTNVQAQESIPVLSTKELVDVCKVSTTGEYRSYCVGYMTSAYDTYLATRNPKHAKPFICVKQPAPPRDEVINGYLKWTQERPALASKPAAGTLLDYLATRFPCGK